MVVVIIMAAALAVPAAIDWATDKTPGANLWMLGAGALFGGTMLGLWVVAGLTRAVWQWTHRA
jgi:hypothetical protein